MKQTCTKHCELKGFDLEFGSPFTAPFQRQSATIQCQSGVIVEIQKKGFECPIDNCVLVLQVQQANETNDFKAMSRGLAPMFGISSVHRDLFPSASCPDLFWIFPNRALNASQIFEPFGLTSTVLARASPTSIGIQPRINR
jgi:hypothetical protein